MNMQTRKQTNYSRQTLNLAIVIVLLSGCATTEDEVGTVVGSSAIGAGIGALAGAALNPWNRWRGAQSGALAGAAIGGVVGVSNVAQERQYQYSSQHAYYGQHQDPYISNTPGCTTTKTEFADGTVTITERCYPQR